MKIYKHALFAELLLTLTFSVFSMSVSAQSTDELKSQMTAYSNEFFASMKKLSVEKNLKTAAGMCKEITGRLSPKLQSLNTKTEAWRKAHSAKEATDLLAWAQNKTTFLNGYAVVNSPAMLISTTRNPDFMQAFFQLKHDLLAPNIMTFGTENHVIDVK